MSDLRSMAGYTSSKYWDNSLAWANIAGETVWGRFLCHVGKVACLTREELLRVNDMLGECNCLLGFEVMRVT